MNAKAILDTAKRTIGLEAAAIDGLQAFLNDDFARAVELVCKCNGRLVVSGIGKSAIIAQKMVATFNSTGTPSLYMHAADAIHGDLGMVQAEDIVMVISKSGNSPEIKVLVPLIKNFGNPLIGLVGNLDSYLALQADIIINSTVSEEACPNNLAPTSSTTAQLVMGDALAVCLMELKGFTGADFAKFHPGGRLGRSLLLTVRDVMRTREEMALVSPSATVLEAVQKMTCKRCGCVTIVDPSGRLAGIFTQGDFARHFPNSPDIGSQMVHKFVTRHPITIAGSKPAIEVLRILQKHRIDDLIVVDASDRPIGLIDSQDLTRLKLV